MRGSDTPLTKGGPEKWLGAIERSRNGNGRWRPELGKVDSGQISTGQSRCFCRRVGACTGRVLGSAGNSSGRGNLLPPTHLLEASWAISDCAAFGAIVRFESSIALIQFYSLDFNRNLFSTLSVFGSNFAIARHGGRPVSFEPGPSRITEHVGLLP